MRHLASLVVVSFAGLLIPAAISNAEVPLLSPAQLQERATHIVEARVDKVFVSHDAVQTNYIVTLQVDRAEKGDRGAGDVVLGEGWVSGLLCTPGGSGVFGIADVAPGDLVRVYLDQGAILVPNGLQQLPARVVSDAALRDDSPESLRTKGEEALTQQLWREARAAGERLRTLRDDPLDLLLLARAQMGMGEPAQASRTLELLLPKNTDAMVEHLYRTALWAASRAAPRESAEGKSFAAKLAERILATTESATSIDACVARVAARVSGQEDLVRRAQQLQDGVQQRERTTTSPGAAPLPTK